MYNLTSQGSLSTIHLYHRRWFGSLGAAAGCFHHPMGLATAHGRLYVAGTFRHGGQLDVAERYDPVAGKWEDLPPMSMLVQFSAGAWVF